MALTVWTQPSGFLGTFQEGLSFDVPLPVSDDAGVNYTKISGEIPPGLYIHDNYLRGTPAEVPRDTVFTFCIRASLNNEISDRTFSINIIGADDPVIITPAGLLDVGIHKQLYVIDNSFVNYQIVATDNDTATGQKLTYFITAGSLPPGLTLSPDGLIYGSVEAVTTLQVIEGNGTYDYGPYSAGPYDFANPQIQNGYDQLTYDLVSYDYFFISQPRTLNRFYEFNVSVTDGDTVSPSTQTFEIFVVNPSTFRADSESLVSNSKWFSADVSYIQEPIWVTPADLGTYRANNYITIMLDVFDTASIYYEIDNVANLPPNITFNSQTGEIYGRLPVQAAITKTYTFTVTAIRYGDLDTSETNRSARTFTVKIAGDIDNVIVWDTPANLGHITAGQLSTLQLRAYTSLPNATMTYSIASGQLPPGLTLAYDGEIIGAVSQYSTQIKFDHNSTTFDKNEDGYRVTFDIYNIRKYPGTHNNISDYILTSELGIRSSNTIFDSNDTLIGMAINTTTFNNSNVKLGITSFDFDTISKTTFDSGTTTIDRVFTFTVDVHDQYYLEALLKTFTITVDIPNDVEYSNIYVKPYMPPAYRTIWSKFINDPSIFTPTSIYRPIDLMFGVQYELAMLIYGGIETRYISDYAKNLSNETIKRFKFGNVQKATAYYPGSTTAVYEIIYINMVDPLLEDTSYQNDNINMWRSQISNIGSSEWTYLPLWMRSIQPNQTTQLGFVAAVPLCYCNVGTADDVMLNIKHSNFDFKMLDYTIDRFIITKVTGYDADKYIIFNNRNHT